MYFTIQGTLTSFHFSWSIHSKLLHTYSFFPGLLPSNLLSYLLDFSVTKATKAVSLEKTYTDISWGGRYTGGRGFALSTVFILFSTF